MSRRVSHIFALALRKDPIDRRRVSGPVFGVVVGACSWGLAAARLSCSHLGTVTERNMALGSRKRQCTFVLAAALTSSGRTPRSGLNPLNTRDEESRPLANDQASGKRPSQWQSTATSSVEIPFCRSAFDLPFLPPCFRRLFGHAVLDQWLSPPAFCYPVWSRALRPMVVGARFCSPVANAKSRCLRLCGPPGGAGVAKVPVCVLPGFRRA